MSNIVRRLTRRGRSPQPSPPVAHVQPELTDQDLNDWIAEGIRGFRQWYQPVDFGDGLVAHVTTPPDWRPHPELDAEYGIDRWAQRVLPLLPDVTGLRILDVGCSSGLFSLELSRMGAAEVVGIDRSLDITHKTGNLANQDVVAQARFVKAAIEARTGQYFNVSFHPCDLGDSEQVRTLGHFDLVLALNVVYHQLSNAERLMEDLAQLTDMMVLQSALKHPPSIHRWADPAWQMNVLARNGFRHFAISYADDMDSATFSAKR